MFRYADSYVCPACRHQIDRTAPACATCGVEILGPPAAAVFAALKQVDALVAELPQHVAVPAARHDAEPGAEPGAVPGAALGLDVLPSPSVPVATRSALSAASVPKILLGLGALCLIVASIVFLVVAWAALGVGGRTGVLAGFTAVATVLMAWVAHRDLRAGAESFGAVALVLLAIDLGGAREAGWLGPVDDGWFLVVAGSVVALAATAIALWVRRTPVATLVSAEVVAALAVAATALGVASVIGDQHPAEAALAATVGCLAGAVAARRLRLAVLTLAIRVEALVAWLALVVVAAERLEPATVQHVWLDLNVWPLVVAAAVAGLVATQTYLPLWSRVSAATAMGVVGTGALTVVSFDESATTLALVQLAVVAVGGAVVAALRDRTWGWAASVPSVVAALALAASVSMLVGTSLEALVPTAVWTSDVARALPGPDIPWTWPLLLPAGVIGICAAAATALACRGERSRPVVVPGAALTLAVLALVPPLYGVPLVVAVVGLLAAATLLGAAAFVTGRTSVGVMAAGVLLVGVAAGLANEWTTLVALAPVLAAALVAERVAHPPLNALGVLATPAAAAGLMWTVGELAGLPESAQALPVVVLLGLSVLRWPGAERETLHALAAGAAVAASVMTADATLLEGWLAGYLTLVGVIATGSALVHPSRRALARVGLGMFALAHVVRLHDLGIDTVEAYTLPLAVVLLVLGSITLVLRDDSSIRALGPGLALALVPSLLLVLEDPVGLRAILLGAACLVLVAIGLVGRVAAPLTAGALVGALVVLRQGTLAELLPQWAIIGLVGVGLTVVGITWEQRLQELRRASAYVRGLR